jgi:phage major head subunit gpT-like protein
MATKVALSELPDDLRLAACDDAGEPLTIELAAADTAADGDAASDKKPKLRSFDMVAYVGGKMKVPVLPLPVVVDISGMRVPGKSTPVLKNHDLDQAVGHTSSVTLGNSIRAKGSISAANDHADHVSSSADNGFPWQASIGAKVDDMQRFEAGEKFEANGRKFVGPAYLAKKTTLREISVTPVGADEQSSTRVAATAITKTTDSSSLSGSGSNMPKFAEWVAAMGFDHATLSDDQKAKLQAKYDAELKASEKSASQANAANTPAREEEPVTAAKAVSDLRAAVATETKRVAGVRKICGGKHADIEARAVEEGWDEQRTELEVLRASRPSGPAIHVAGALAKDGPAIPAVIEAALCMAVGISADALTKRHGADQKVINAAMGRHIRGIGLHFLIHETIRAAGKYAPAGRVGDDTIRAAFEADQMLRATYPSENMIYAGGEFSTVSLSGILSNLANKLLLESFTAVDAVGASVAGVRDAVDFKPTYTYRLTQAGIFEQVAGDGELKLAQLTDETYSNQVQTYGKIIALTRQQMINDDLGAFAQIPKLLGRASALALEKAIFTLLLANANSYDGNPLFSTEHANYQSGGGTVLDIDSLTSAEQLFLDQVDSQGEPILVAPKYLLVPTALKVPAENLMNSNIVVGVPANNLLSPNQNPHAGKWAVKSSPFLNAQGLANQSSTAWYLLADPADVATIEVAYLRGTRTPIIESAETNFNILGMQWRGFFDFGVAQQDWRGGVKSAGA